MPLYFQRYSKNSGRCHKLGQPYNKFIGTPQLRHPDLGFRRSDSANLPALYPIVLVLFPPDFATHRFLPKTTCKKHVFQFSFLALFVGETCSYTIRGNAYLYLH